MTFLFCVWVALSVSSPLHYCYSLMLSGSASCKDLSRILLFFFLNKVMPCFHIMMKEKFHVWMLDETSDTRRLRNLSVEYDTNDGLHTAGLQSPNDLMHQSSDVLKTCSSLIKLSLRLIKSRSAHMFLHIFALLPWMYLYNTIFAPLNMKPQTRGGLA